MPASRLLHNMNHKSLSSLFPPSLPFFILFFFPVFLLSIFSFMLYCSFIHCHVIYFYLDHIYHELPPSSKQSRSFSLNHLASNLKPAGLLFKHLSMQGWQGADKAHKDHDGVRLSSGDGGKGAGACRHGGRGAGAG